MWHVTDANAPLDVGLRYIAHGGRSVPSTVDDAEAWAELQRATRAAISKSHIRPLTDRTP